MQLVKRIFLCFTYDRRLKGLRCKNKLAMWFFYKKLILVTWEQGYSCTGSMFNHGERKKSKFNRTITIPEYTFCKLNLSDISVFFCIIFNSVTYSMTSSTMYYFTKNTKGKSLFLILPRFGYCIMIMDVSNQWRHQELQYE